MASLLYGSGLRLTECMKLRIKDIDFNLNEIIDRADKGDNDRRTILPRLLKPQLTRQIEKAKIKLEENMLLKNLQVLLFQKYWKESTRMLLKNWPGNIFFPPGNPQLTIVQEN